MMGRSTPTVAAPDDSSPAPPPADDDGCDPVDGRRKRSGAGSEEEKKEEKSGPSATTPPPTGPSGDGSSGDGGKDRRAMLEEWKRKRALERSASSSSSSTSPPLTTWNGYRSPQQQQAKGGGVHRSRSSASLTGGGGGASRKNLQHQHHHHHHRSGSSPPMYHQYRRKQPLPQAATQQAKNVTTSRQRRKEVAVGGSAGGEGKGDGVTACAPPTAPNHRGARRRNRRPREPGAGPPQPQKQSPSPTTSPAGPTAKGETPIAVAHAKDVGLKLATTDSDLLDGEDDDKDGTPSLPGDEETEEQGTENNDDGDDEDDDGDEDEEVTRARHMALAASALSGLPPDEIRRRAVAVFGGSASPSLSSSTGTVDLFFTPPSSPPRRILRVGGDAAGVVEGSETRRRLPGRANDDGEAEAHTREVLRRHVHDLTSQLVRTKAERDEARSVLASTLENLRDAEARAADLRRELEDVTRESELASAESARVLAEVEAETDSYTARLVAVAAELDRVGEERRMEREEIERRHAEEVDGLRFALRVQRHEDDAGARGGDGIDDDGTMTPAVALARIEERDERIAELEAAVARGERERRAMHNRIQELRGNIRVYVRARPFVRDDLAGGDGGEEGGDEGGADDLTLSSPISVNPDGQGLVVADVRNGNEELSFKFDKVFGPAAGQEDVFREVSELVQSALDGYNVCLFSYGQTGSGKTHTMQGSGTGEMRGIIPRAVELVLKQARALADHHRWEFQMTASFLEIYNEAIRDLLPPDLVDDDGDGGQSGGELSDASSHGSGKRGSKRSGGAKLSIKRDPNGRLYVQGLNRVSVDPTDGEVGARRRLDAVMAAAAACRSVASTSMNAQSSRSHAVFVLDLRGRNRDTGAVVTGALHLCDLAGSERLDRTGHDVSTAEGSRRMREVQSINRSLSTLGDVFNALAVGSPHVPYRNSKLTYLLQDCLGGDGKALMFVNLSPTSESCGESLCSLRFAQRVNQVELGKASKNVQLSSSRVGKV